MAPPALNPEQLAYIKSKFESALSDYKLLDAHRPLSHWASTFGEAVLELAVQGLRTPSLVEGLHAVISEGDMQGLPVAALSREALVATRTLNDSSHLIHLPDYDPDRSSPPAFDEPEPEASL
jgi:hypothetical protein